MPISITTLSSTDTLDARFFDDMQAELEDYLNGGQLQASDLGSGAGPNPFVSYHQLPNLRPFGSPHPRVLGTSFEAFWRRTGDQVNARTLFYYDFAPDQWLPIPGLCAPVHVQSSKNSEDPHLRVRANFTTYNFDPTSSSTLATGTDDEAHPAAKFALHVDGTRIDWTRRTMRASVPAYEEMARKTHNIDYFGTTALTDGMHKVGVYVRCIKPSTARDWLNIWITSRNFYAEVLYL